MNIPDQAIKAAAEGLYERAYRQDLPEAPFDLARAALEAALPHIRAQIAADIRAAAETRYAYSASERTRSISIRDEEPRISKLAMEHAWALSQQADGLSEAARIAEGSDQ